MKKIRVSYTLDENLVNFIRELAEKNRRTFTAQLELIIDEYRKNQS